VATYSVVVVVVLVVVVVVVVAVVVTVVVVVVVLLVVVEATDLRVDKTIAVSFTWVSWKKTNRKDGEKLLVSQNHILWMTLTLALMLLLILL
jgi:accessory colonization factor AcfC